MEGEERSTNDEKGRRQDGWRKEKMMQERDEWWERIEEKRIRERKSPHCIHGKHPTVQMETSSNNICSLWSLHELCRGFDGIKLSHFPSRDSSRFPRDGSSG